MKCISINSYCGEISSVNVIRSSINLVFLSLFCNYEKPKKKKSDFVNSKFPVKVRNDRNVLVVLSQLYHSMDRPK